MDLPIEQGRNGFSPLTTGPFHLYPPLSGLETHAGVIPKRLTLFSSFHADQRSAVASAGNGSWVNGSAQQ